MHYSFEKYSENQGVYLNNPISAELNNHITPLFKVCFGDRFTIEYMYFLTLTDGIQINNVIIFSAEELISELSTSQTSLELGSNGNMDAYKFCAIRNQYLVVNFFAHDDVFESFDTLPQLFDYIISISL